MKESFKEFWSSFWDLQKQSNEWLKNHWKGYLILVLAICIPFWICIAVGNYLEEKKIQKQIDQWKKED